MFSLTGLPYIIYLVETFKLYPSLLISLNQILISIGVEVWFPLVFGFQEVFGFFPNLYLGILPYFHFKIHKYEVRHKPQIYNNLTVTYWSFISVGFF